MEEPLLTITTGSDETANETANWTEYHFEGELVKRDVHLILIQPSISSNTQIGEF